MPNQYLKPEIQINKQILKGFLHAKPIFETGYPNTKLLGDYSYQ